MRRKKQYKGYRESEHIWVERGAMIRSCVLGLTGYQVTSHEEAVMTLEMHLLRKIARITIQKSVIDYASNSNQIHI